MGRGGKREGEWEGEERERVSGKGREEWDNGVKSRETGKEKRVRMERSDSIRKQMASITVSAMHEQ